MHDGRFDINPQVSRRLNVLPDNPDEDAKGRFPKWLHRKLPPGGNLWKTHDILKTHSLSTVCEEARCPNLLECYSKKTATFLAMGKECTRNCGFCDVDFAKEPKALEADEPIRLARAVKDLGLAHVVITMVARDDLHDGGAAHLVAIIEAVRSENPTVTIEVLTSDFGGSTASYDTILASKPEIFNHNIETVRSLSPKVRHKASYDRTLAALRYMREHGHQGLLIKSALMVGLGETTDEVYTTLRDLKEVGCDIVAIGHYLQPNRKKLRVKSFVTPVEFEDYAAYGHSIGISHVYSGPFVRSSYNAASLFTQLKAHDRTQ